MDRRDFLSLSGAVLLGTAAAACSNDKDAEPSNPAAKTGSIAELTKGKRTTVNPAVVQPLLGKREERLALGLVKAEGADRGQPHKGGTAKAWLAKNRTDTAIGPIDLTYHGEGYEFGVYVGRVTLPEQGDWLVYVEGRPDGATSPLSGGTTITVGNVPTAPNAKPQPVPGEKAIVVASPTAAAPAGVNPICTRKPACSMHQVSLDAALKSGKPVVLTIGTPAFCQTRFCGPLVDQLMKVQTRYAKLAHFVHVELYKDDEEAVAKQQLAPAAAAWRVEAEPATYYIRRDGTIAEWTIGASDAPEMVALTQKILAR